jgi:hypothetical protein
MKKQVIFVILEKNNAQKTAYFSHFLIHLEEI